MSGKWIIASNRLPFNKDARTGELVRSSGGLISAITGIQSDAQIKWVGAVPPSISPAEWKQAKKNDAKNEYVPLFLSKATYHSYYNNIANDVLWPLLHYESNRVKFNPDDWENYRKVNEQFANKIVECSSTGDLVWIHDFHLFLVPGFLKARRPNLKVGFFLHIPFPSSEIFRQLPVREEILESLLASDLVGFHDYSYLRHFSYSLKGVLGIDTNLYRIDRGDHSVKLGVFPVSIDTQRFQKESKSAAVKKRISEYEKGSKTQFLVLGVDRLDYIKGIQLKLLAFRSMLENHPELQGKVSLLQIAVPSRTNVPEYSQLRDQIAMTVGQINGEFGRVGYVPIQYMYTSVPFDQLLSLYRLADILLVTSKRDGMNLVCLEYLASQDPSDPGEVLLSEFAGAISTLSHVKPINPWDTDRTGEAIAQSLTAERDDRVANYEVMMDYLEKYTATSWAESFMTSLGEETSEQVRETPMSKGGRFHLPKEIRKKLRGAPLLILCDYDGTLSPITEKPEQAQFPADTSKRLKKLIKAKDVRFAIISGRDSEFLESQFDKFDLILGAEHGAKVYRPETKAWESMVHTPTQSWYPTALRIMEDYVSRVPGSMIERKEYGLCWHYRRSPVEFAAYQARKLEEDLEWGLIHSPATVLAGKKVIEVRPVEANKGNFANWIMDTFGSEERVVISVGDDQTDEDLFAATPKKGVTIKVGLGQTRATYRLSEQTLINEFLDSLSDL